MTDTTVVDWPVGPLISGDWRDLESDLLTKLHDRLKDHGALNLELDELRCIRVLPLECYPRYLSAEALLAKKHNPAAVKWFLYGPTGAHPVTGDSQVLHGLNDQSALEVNSPTAADQYLRLFCAATHGDGGPFVVLDGSEHLDALFSENTKISSEDIAKLHPVTVEPRFGGNWCADACIYYDGVVFSASFRVDETGSVEMIEDNPLFETPPLALSIAGAVRTPLLEKGVGD